MITPRIIFIDTVDSTSSALHRMLADMPTLPHGTTVTTRCQTAGRGQRGNRWESAPESNVMLSILLRPEDIAPADQFVISEAVALATAEFVRSLLPGMEDRITIKWPNDIYVDDRKISGMLIEHVIQEGRIVATIAGIGVNINQREWLSDAPNPVSVWQLTGVNHSLTVLEEDLVNRIIDSMRYTLTPEGRRYLHTRFLEMLWRRKGFHPFLLAADNSHFMAEIVDVAPDGMITLRHKDGQQSTHAFKEIHFIL